MAQMDVTTASPGPGRDGVRGRRSLLAGRAVKLGVVVPRYGEEVVGGAEHWIRALGEHMVTMRGWAVDVFTTCAVSAETWADHYRPGSVELNGVTVHRYRSRSGRNPEYLEMYPRLQRDPSSISEADARTYVELVGPVCPDATAHAASSDCDLVAVTPYLYWPSVDAVRRLGTRAVFHCAAHDEPELYFPMMRDVFASVGGFAFNSFSERELVERTYEVAHIPSCVTGIPVEHGTGDPGRAREAIGLGPDEPFVLYVGRVERSKGVGALLELWSLYRRRRHDAPRLVLVGPVQDSLDVPEGVLVAGRQPEEVKWGALGECAFFVLPSSLESFSLVVLEAWLAGRPVVVNGRCGPTVEHCVRSGGGLWFDEYADFEVAADSLLGDPSLCRSMGARGGSYARSAFTWERIVGGYEQLAARVSSSAATARRQRCR